MISEIGKAIVSEPFGRSFGGAGKQARGKMSETGGLLLDDLVPEAARVMPNDDVAIAGINADSRALQAGEAFFALPGSRQHGNAFIEAAVTAGARAIVTDEAPARDPGIPVVVVEDVREAYARAAALQFAPQPEVAVAVTGTNGNTSVDYLVVLMCGSSLMYAV
jgi:UDP-N-acetylmuramyl tripeptide synthase